MQWLTRDYTSGPGAYRLYHTTGTVPLESVLATGNLLRIITTARTIKFIEIPSEDLAAREEHTLADGEVDDAAWLHPGTGLSVSSHRFANFLLV